ncbi:MAG: hypothetical protein LBD62_04015 [Candidatus Margulisbacteria bacterium]|jgi:hypothetical protein|nr:hypothetical protein [Candidatus Margulisiibacteriota bacterium]
MTWQKCLPNLEDQAKSALDIILPELNPVDLALLKKRSKPVLLKSTILQKEKTNHADINSNQYSKIIGSALYSPNYILQVKPQEKPNYFTFIQEATGAIVVLEMLEDKANFEIVSFNQVRRKSLEQYKRKTKMEDGLFLITTRK